MPAREDVWVAGDDIHSAAGWQETAPSGRPGTTTGASGFKKWLYSVVALAQAWWVFWDVHEPHGQPSRPGLCGWC